MTYRIIQFHSNVYLEQFHHLSQACLQFYSHNYAFRDLEIKTIVISSLMSSIFSVFLMLHFISLNYALINDHSPSVSLVPGLNVGLSVVSPGPVLVETVLLVDTPVDMFIISNTTQY